MPANPPLVSVTEPLSPALQRVKTLLFAPFDLKKWLAIGFCAWLSSCGESGGGGQVSAGNHSGNSPSRGDIKHGLHHAWDYVMDNLGWILPLVIMGLLIVLVLWVVATWLNSRGKFMFLHCVALNRAEIQVPWERYAQHGQSLFIFQLILGGLGFVLIGPAVLAAIACLLLLLAGEGSVATFVVIGISGMLLAILLGIAFAIVKKLLVDFVVPIMYLRHPSVWNAWREFFALASPNLGRLALYLLFSVVIAMVIGTLVFMIVILTCCLAGCLMAIPYIGTVFLLPVLVFKRAYSLRYLEQYGPQFRVIAPEEIPIG